MNNGVSLIKQDFITTADADRLFAALSVLPWSQHVTKMYGKEVPMPRLYQWMGIPPQPKIYGAGALKNEGGIYSGETFTPIEWTPEAREIQQRVYEATGFLFDSLNINYYRNESDHLGWHVDKEDEGLWEFPIASVSLGAVREFQTRQYTSRNPHKRWKRNPVGDTNTFTLSHGSLVVMPAGSQGEFLHRLKQTSTPCGARINLTFRMMTPAVEAATA